MVASDEVFSKIEVRLGKVDPAKRKLVSVYKFNITDNSGAILKTWLLDLSSIKLSISDGPADCTFTVSDDVMTDIGAGKLTISDGVAQGKVKVDGDKSIAELLQPFVAEL